MLGASGGWRNGSDASLPTPGTFQLLDSPQTPLLTLEALVTQQHISRWSRQDIIGSSGMVGTSSSFDNNNNGEGRSLRNRVGVHMRSIVVKGVTIHSILSNDTTSEDKWASISTYACSPLEMWKFSNQMYTT